MFIQFHQIHYKSKRPTSYRTSHSTIRTQILMQKYLIYKVTIIIQAGNKMALIYGYLIDLICMIGRSISTIAYDKDLVIKNIHSHSTLYIVHDKRNGT